MFEITYEDSLNKLSWKKKVETIEEAYNAIKQIWDIQPAYIEIWDTAKCEYVFLKRASSSVVEHNSIGRLPDTISPLSVDEFPILDQLFKVLLNTYTGMDDNTINNLRKELVMITHKGGPEDLTKIAVCLKSRVVPYCERFIDLK